MEYQDDRSVKRWVSIYQNNRITSFQSLTGRAFAVPDAEGAVRNVQSGSSNEVLGEALWETLSYSRFITPETFNPTLIDHREIDRVFKMRLDQLARDSGFSSTRRIFQSLRFCSVTEALGQIKFEPTRRIRGNEYQDLRMPPIVVADNVDALALGAAVRLAMSKCEA